MSVGDTDTPRYLFKSPVRIAVTACTFHSHQRVCCLW